MPVGIKPVNSLSLQHQQTVLHDVRLDEGQRRARLIRENVHRHVELRFVRQQHLQARVFIAEERLVELTAADALTIEKKTAVPTREPRDPELMLDLLLSALEG